MSSTLRNAALLLAAAVAVAISVPPARAAGAVNIGWEDCALAGPSTAAATFACNTNSGVNNLIVSFQPPATLTQLYAVESTLSLTTSGATLSPWWHFESGGCHAPITTSVLFDTGPFTCVDVWSPDAVSAIDYTPSYYAPNSSRIRLICAVAQGNERTVNPGSEYYTFRVTLRHAKTVGATGCPGCSEGACFQLVLLTLRQSNGAGDYDVPGGAQSMVTWNGGASGCVVPVHKRTWGAIKGQYR
jgi:hypothetical protein